MMVPDDSKGGARLSQRHDFALQHMLAATRFDQLCYEVELANANQPYGPFFEEIRSYTSAIVFSSVAALEANINEAFADILDRSETFDSSNSLDLKTSWRKIEKKPMLTKYERYLKLTDHSELDRNDVRYRSVGLLIRVRNALVHYKPKWDSELKEFDEIGNQLIGKFEFSPFLDENAPIFPMRCMTHGFTHWSVQSALKFAELFASSTDTRYRFKQLWNRGGRP